MNKKDYALFYEQLTADIRKNPKNIRLLVWTNRILTYLMYAMYPLLLILLAVHRDDRFWQIFLIPAVSFEAVTWIRSSVNRKRPYESWKIDPLIHKDTKGHSMPSRHVFSSAMISVSWLYIVPWVGWLLLALSIVSAWVRVAGGVHYPSDVIVGYIIGLACGLLFLL